MQSHPNDSTRSRMVELDSLRGVASILVLGFHFTVQYQNFYADGHHAAVALPWGRYGVQFFFVISGFVIFMTMTRAETIADFVANRISRLFPTFWTCLAITCVVLLAFPLPDTSLSWQQILANATMLPYYLRAEYVDEVYWTLTVELAFYAFACLWRWRGWLQAPEPFIAVWLGVELLATWLEAYVRPVPAVIATAMLLQYGHFFFAGVLFHQIRQHGFTALRGCLLVACIMVAWVVRDAPHAFALLISSVIFVALIKGWLRCLAVRPLLFCGAISYPLYLLHERVGFVMIHQLRAAGCTSDVWLLAPVVTMVPLAWAIHALVEDPAQLWLRDRWKHSALRARLQLARRR